MKDFLDLITLIMSFFGLMLIVLGTWKLFLSTEVSDFYPPMQSKPISSFVVIYRILSKRSHFVNHPFNKDSIMLNIDIFNRTVFLILWGFAFQFFSIVISIVSLIFYMIHKGAG